MPQYQTRRRLYEAVRDLRVPDSNVDAVAKLVGYSSPKNLYAALRAETGLTPSAVRAMSRIDVEVLLEGIGAPWLRRQ
jgi:AraC-like DNA-binding protein